jgi:hypothetical protein
MVSVVSSRATPEVGETFDVNITVSDVSNLFAWQAGIQWDPSILQFVSFAWGDFQSLTGGSTGRYDAVIANNVMTWPALESMGRIGTPLTTSTAPVNLLTITFTAIALSSGFSPVKLTDVELRGQSQTDTTAYIPWSDVNQDNRVDIKDLAVTAKCYAKNTYNASADFNDDGVIDITDIAIVSSDFGKNNGSPGWGVTKTIYPIIPTLQDSGVTTTRDVTPPTTTVSLSGTQVVPPWFTGSVQVTLEATDPSGTIVETDYSFDGYAWTKYTVPFVINDEGATTVYYYSTDSAGNVEATKSETVYIDTSAPVITITSPTAQDYLQSGTLAISYDATDVVSGLASVTAALGCDPARIYVDPVTSQGMAGQTFTVNIMVDQVADLYVWCIKMYFDPTILECTNAVLPQDHIFADKQFSFARVIDNDAGILMVGATLLGTEPTFTGSGKLVQVEFKVKSAGSGSSNLEFDTISDETFLLDSNPIQCRSGPCLFFGKY